MPDYGVRGGENLARIARELRETGSGGLRRELLRGVRASARTAIPDVELAALDHLPRRGGLAARVAAQRYAVRASLTGDRARVRIIGQGMRELRLIDQGMVRHPAWGTRSRWVLQTRGITPGFFTGTLRQRAPEVRRQIDQVMRDIKVKIEKGV